MTTHSVRNEWSSIEDGLKMDGSLKWKRLNHRDHCACCIAIPVIPLPGNTNVENKIFGHTIDKLHAQFFFLYFGG